MKLMVSFVASALALLVLAAAPAQAKEGYKTHQTKFFSIELPSSFALMSSTPTKWTYKSQKGHYVLGITAYPMSKKPIAVVGEKLLKDFVEKGQNVQILEKKATHEDGKDLFYTVAKSTRTYKDHTNDYLTMRLLVHSATLNKLVTITLSVSAEKSAEFGKLCEHVVDSLTFQQAK